MVGVGASGADHPVCLSRDRRNDQAGNPGQRAAVAAQSHCPHGSCGACGPWPLGHRWAAAGRPFCPGSWIGGRWCRFGDLACGVPPGGGCLCCLRGASAYTASGASSAVRLELLAVSAVDQPAALVDGDRALWLQRSGNPTPGVASRSWLCCCSRWLCSGRSPAGCGCADCTCP